MKLILFLGFALLVAGCAGMMPLNMHNPEARDYATSLASEYMEFAQSEAEQRRNFTAEYLAAKARLILDDQPVLPEGLDRWPLPQHLRGELGKARQALLEVAGEDVRRVVPQKAARAQLLFDCWVVHAGQHRQESEIDACRQEFYAVMDELKPVHAQMTKEP